MRAPEEKGGGVDGAHGVAAAIGRVELPAQERPERHEALLALGDRRDLSRLVDGEVPAASHTIPDRPAEAISWPPTNAPVPMAALKMAT